MNKFLGIGNVVKKPELRTSANGTEICTFTIAINNTHGEKDTTYLPIVTFSKLATNCHTYLDKGKKVGVSGRIQVRSYDANNGDKRYVTEIVADEVEFLTPKGEEKDFEPETGENNPF